MLLNVPARLSDTYIKLSKILSFGTNFIDFFFFNMEQKNKSITYIGLSSKVSEIGSNSLLREREDLSFPNVKHLSNKGYS